MRANESSPQASELRAKYVSMPVFGSKPGAETRLSGRDRILLLRVSQLDGVHLSHISAHAKS